MDNSLLAVRDINHKYIAGGEYEAIQYQGYIENHIISCVNI